jgi:hypothetical protein
MNDELIDSLDRLFAEFDMETGYPSHSVLTADGPVWGIVNEDLQLILEDLWKIREELEG